MKLTIGHLYPKLMNIYGDRGNIITLANRSRWREISVEVKDISLGEPIDPEIDLFFFGGGQDKEQILVASDLQEEKGRALIEAVENGAVLLSICGGYQLLGQYYRPHLGEDLPGIGLFDSYTVAGEKRMIGNVVIEISDSLQSDYSRHAEHPKTLVGFENHSGKTYLGKNCQPLGRVVIGFGNNGEDRQEGAVYKNAFGCYLHGPVLPKNPHFADYLIQQALRRKNPDFQLSPLNDSLETLAHQAAISRAKSTR
ncbi:MAG: glutamine amidotransferase [Patescibacteria group bacterium]|nr:glutamine amidotransferase [Patescibacteria group bacterium]